MRLKHAKTYSIFCYTFIFSQTNTVAHDFHRMNFSDSLLLLTCCLTLSVGLINRMVVEMLFTINIIGIIVQAVRGYFSGYPMHFLLLNCSQKLW